MAIVPPAGGSGAQTFAYSAGRASRTAVQRFSVVPTELTAVATTYDTEDQPLVVTETRSGSATSVEFGYDGRGLLTSIKRGTDVVGYGRRASGAMSSITSPAGTVTYGYDGLERLETTQSGSGPVTTLSWEAGGARLLEASDPMRLRQCWRYDARGRIARASNVLPGDDCDDEIRTQPLAEFRYGYDERGNRLWEDYRDANTSTLERTAYGYDAADRLTGVQYPSGAAELYRLGGDGSRMGQKNPAAFAGSLGPAGYASANAPEQEYRYDRQGGLTAITDGAGGLLATYEVDTSGRVRVEARGAERSEYTWDAGGRLVSAVVEKAGTTKTLHYEYDFAGRRIRKTGPAGESRYLWGAGELVEEIGPTGTRLQYERGAGMALAVTSVSAGGQLMGRERLMHDALGSVVGRVGESGEPVLYRFDAWGAFRGAEQPAGASEPTLAYAGQHWDADVGLSYAQQRWYAPGTGRFLSEDPVFGDVTNPASLLAYAYANANPLLYVDPLGEAGGFWSSMNDNFRVMNNPASPPVFRAQAATQLKTQMDVVKYGSYAVGGTAVGGAVVVAAAPLVAGGGGAAATTTAVAPKTAGIIFALGTIGARYGNRIVSLGKQARQGVYKHAISPIVDGVVNTASSVGTYVSDLVRYGPRVANAANAQQMTQVVQTGISLADPNPAGSMAETIGTYARRATRDAGSDIVVLGKWSKTGTSYDRVAQGMRATYFNLDQSEWEAAEKLLGKSEMWKVNQAFLEDQVRLGKSFLLSHDPLVATGYFKQEVEFLIARGYRFVKEGDMWRAVR